MRISLTTQPTERVAPAISVRSLAAPDQPRPVWLSVLGPVIDWALGLGGIDRLYKRSAEIGQTPAEFARRVLSTLELSVHGDPADLVERVPEKGATLLVCNHPFGGVEALILAARLLSVRSDVKFLANSALRVFPELSLLLITTNPLKTSVDNIGSIRKSERHLRSGGLLVIFPAGKVSYFDRATASTSDAPWNRLVGHLAIRGRAVLVPVFFSGSNSRWFRLVSRFWDRARILLLPRELLRMHRQSVHFAVGRPVQPSLWEHMTTEQITAYARLLTYELDPRLRLSARLVTDTKPSLQPVASPEDPLRMAGEIAALPGEQKLSGLKNFGVYWANAEQIPTVLNEITRERERTFREHSEGSGMPRDSDEFDRTYQHLFVWDDQELRIVGAYRIGRTDELRRHSGNQGLYLNQMFEFAPDFHDEGGAALELGRSFVVPEHQRSFHGLYLLWLGIGGYLVRFPHYRRLYGTVSLSTLYDRRAIAALCDLLIEHNSSVRPRAPLDIGLGPEWIRCRSHLSGGRIRDLSALLRGLDGEGKDVPVLLRHYLKIGAKFLAAGVDRKFSNTPGLLLSVDVAALPHRTLHGFLGDMADAYIAHGTGSYEVPGCGR